MPYLGKQAQEGGVHVEEYSWKQGTDTSTGTDRKSVV